MKLLAGIRFWGKNTFNYRGFGLFGDNLPNASTQTIKSIGKRYHSNDINVSNQWIKNLDEQQQQTINFIRNEVNFVIYFIVEKFG